MTALQAYCPTWVFDGTRLHRKTAVLVQDGRVSGLCPAEQVPAGADVTEADGILCAGFVDLQVNGGGGVLFNDAPTVATLRRMAAAHAALGTIGFLPTLITDTPDATARAISATQDAIAQGVEGILGLHLEGPHLAPARKGAHDGALIRPMDDTDLSLLCDAAVRLPVLKVTVAPETVTPDQITHLTCAGVLVSLGHSDATYDLARRATDAGARCVTHLFNAMSQLSSREPGLVGAALGDGRLSVGLIADGVHVHPATIRAALAAKQGPLQLFLVTDAMATTGSDITEFTLNGRRILRADGRLTLEDGTLAGADLTLPDAIRFMVEVVGIPLDQALAMASTIPATLIGHPNAGRIIAGETTRLIHLDARYRAGVIDL